MSQIPVQTSSPDLWSAPETRHLSDGEKPNNPALAVVCNFPGVVCFTGFAGYFSPSGVFGRSRLSPGDGQGGR